MKGTASDGVTTTVHDFGGAGPVLLFVHATGMHGRIWKPIADHLLDRAHCVAPDLRGHGDSPTTAGYDFPWTGFGRDVLAATHTLTGAGPAMGIGHSLGGAALLMAELQTPGTFDRILLYEPAVHTGTAGDGSTTLVAARDAMVALTRQRRSTFPSRAEALANYRSKPPMSQFHARVLAEYVEHGCADRNDGLNAGVTLKCLPDNESRMYAASYDHDISGRLHEIGCPVTVVAGTETQPFQRRNTDALASQFGVETVLMHGAAHFGPMQQPQQFAEVIARHMLSFGGAAGPHTR